jgi:hypothetical protein
MTETGVVQIEVTRAAGLTQPGQPDGTLSEAPWSQG